MGNAVLLLQPSADAIGGSLLLHIGPDVNDSGTVATLPFNNSQSVNQALIDTAAVAAGYSAGDITITYVGSDAGNDSFSADGGWTLTFSGSILGNAKVPPILGFDASGLDASPVAIYTSGGSQAGVVATSAISITNPGSTSYDSPDGSDTYIQIDGINSDAGFPGDAYWGAAGLFSTMTATYPGGVGPPSLAYNLTMNSGASGWDGSLGVALVTNGADQIDSLVFTGAGGGTFTIATDRGPTATIAFGASQATISAALSALWSNYGNVSVTQISPSSYTLDWNPIFGANPENWGVDGSSLTGALTVTESVQTPGGGGGGAQGRGISTGGGM